MVNPVVEMANAFIAIYDYLPVSISALIGLACALFIIMVLINILMHLR